MHSLLKRGGKVKMTTTLLETYSIALEGTSDLNRRILKENRELQAEVKRLNDQISHLNRQREQLRSDAVHDADVCYDLDDKHIKTIEELKAELSKFQSGNAKEYVDKLKAENDKLKHSLKHKAIKVNTSHFADEWFNNNPKCNKVYVFVLDADGVGDDGWIADSHAVVSVNDGYCVGSYDRKVIDNS